MSRLAIRTIGETVAAAGGVEWVDIVADRRARPAVEARQVGMWQARRRTGASLPVIGRVFSRDHTTVLHACQRVDLWGDHPLIAASDAALDAAEAALGKVGIAEPLEPDAIVLARSIQSSARAASTISVDDIRAMAEHILQAEEEIRWRGEMDTPLRRLLTAEDALDVALGSSGEAAAREERRQALSLVLRTFKATSRI